MGKHCTFPPLFSRSKKFKRNPKHFTFDIVSIYKSNLIPQTKHDFPHWTKYPNRTTRIIDKQTLVIRLRRTKFINRWIYNFVL
jgi:hypothetical protein